MNDKKKKKLRVPFQINKKTKIISKLEQTYKSEDENSNHLLKKIFHGNKRKCFFLFLSSPLPFYLPPFLSFFVKKKGKTERRGENNFVFCCLKSVSFELLVLVAILFVFFPTQMLSSFCSLCCSRAYCRKY